MSDRQGEDQGVQATGVAGTPSSFPACAAPDTLDALEFSATLSEVAARAVTALGAARVRSRVPVADQVAVRTELGRLTELTDLLRLDDPFRPQPLDDVRDVLDRLAVPGAVLDGRALADLGRALSAVHATGASLKRVEVRVPRVAELAVPLPPPAVGRAIDGALDADGAVREGADRTVDRARRRVREARDALVALLQRTLHALPSSARGGDAGVTLRGGRYVIPVPRDARGRVPGIAHGESGSGGTIFVEPHAAVDLGNALSGAEAEEARAVHALLRGLCEHARPHVAVMRDALEMCVRVDDLYARARYALDVGAAPPQTTAAPGALRLRGARHPLLLAEGVEAVPFGLTLEEGERAVVVSGPNTGGKTVMLKTVGLTSALVQAGVAPPLDDGSVLPVFNRIVADIGDHQSIEANLSTFSAHLAALKVALDAADDRALVLFDEMGSGTDPGEGAALAGAALVALVGRGCRVVATTHLTALKQLATETDGIVNASLQFDAESLTPTYQLTTGVPGRSYGLVIARRLGVPEDVLRDAESRTSDQERTLDALLAQAERRAIATAEHAQEVERDAARLARAEADAARRREDLEERQRAVARREKELEREGRERARRFLLDARKRVEEALGVARAAVSEATAKEARRLVERGISDEADELKRLERELAQKGWTVRTGGRTPGPGSGPRQYDPARRAHDVDRPASRAPGIETATSAIDVRGMTVDEAREAVIRALDGAVVADLPVLRVIHGKGTGALRTAVAELLAGDARVTTHRLAPPREGGSGVTVAELAR